MAAMASAVPTASQRRRCDSVFLSVDGTGIAAEPLGEVKQPGPTLAFLVAAISART
jgi:hypothetical protein